MEVSKKDKAKSEAEQKQAVTSCKANSQIKKRQILEAQAHKAAARAEALHIHLATSTPSTKGFPSHALKKSKGIERPTAVTSPSSLMSHLSPQRKSAVVKKWVMINSPLCSEGRSFSSRSGTISGSGDDYNTESGSSGAPPLCQPLAAGQFGWVSSRGGQHTAPPLEDPPPLVVARGIHLTWGEE